MSAAAYDIFYGGWDIIEDILIPPGIFFNEFVQFYVKTTSSLGGGRWKMCQQEQDLDFSKNY